MYNTQECQSLEDKLGCPGATTTLLKAEASLKEVKRDILKVDWETCLSTASRHGSTAVAANISSSASWMKLWDMALDHGPRSTAALQALYSTLTSPRFGQNICSICETEAYFEHLCNQSHTHPQPRARHRSSRAQKCLKMHGTFFYFCAMPCLWLICTNFEL